MPKIKRKAVPEQTTAEVPPVLVTKADDVFLSRYPKMRKKLSALSKEEFTVFDKYLRTLPKNVLDKLEANPDIVEDFARRTLKDKDFAEALRKGDTGKIDELKIQIKNLSDNSVKLNIDLNNLKSANGSKGDVLIDRKKTSPSSADEAATFAKEVNLGNKAAKIKNDKLILNTMESEPTVDGIWKSTGQAVQLKTVGFNKLTTRINQSFSNVIGDSYWKGKGIDVHIECPDGKVQSVQRKWADDIKQRDSPTKNNNGSIKSVTVYCSDGIISLFIP
ncbi:MAG: hypothetical protein MUF42_14220 [Cytophagaceae bacterium]|nr:hypothetical protein [Cytophagaceae bacterium]